MKKETREYLNDERNNFQKLSEIQFDHFMRVFYFWTAVVTAPLTAGLFSGEVELDSQTFGIFLSLIGIIAFFLTIKIFDIRCSQLKYIAKINQIRALLYLELEDDDLLDKYQSLLSPGNDLQEVARNDFGMKMAFTMSGINAAFLSFAFPILFPQIWVGNKFNCVVLILVWIIGFAWYFQFVRSKVPNLKSYLPKDFK